ncbi:hypothetical protein CEY16_06180 [Halalkalibacillus sediminis]|uniref:Uncharacterized protein n=1 Tax=Halalkalibacillus sediminis TaxID=2018042 RepID=A0A2I0QYB2_9BACI|nr:hypothetical protein [Halalkalibacillus sediminis]PKR79326.1 hypothetical protein CEY16_06180 [Halalkalibacillus sediminis]
MKKLKMIVSLIVVFGLLGACSQSKEEIFNQSERQVKDVFISSELIEPNTEFKNFNIFKPDELEVLEDGKNNVVFTDGEQPYILFINELEEPNSKWFYNQVIESEEKSDYLTTFENDEEFAYFNVIEKQDESYELQLGIGGVKMATISEKDEIEADVTKMIQMIKSLERK